MVIGSGLLANALIEFERDERILVFASGVSNSSETRINEFERERNLLISHLGFDGLVVYIGTSSVNDPSLSESLYIRHKLDMEELVMNRLGDSIVFRLPIVVGQSKNRNTLINFLKDRIESNEAFELQKSACRHFIGHSDLTGLLPDLIRDDSFRGRVVNVRTTERVTLPDLLATLEKLLNVTATYSLVEKGSCYEIDIPLDLREHPSFEMKTVESLLREDYL